MDIPLYEVNKFYKALVIDRPSKKIKSPYLADIQLFNDNDQNILMEEVHMAHSPALGCCGLIAKNSVVYVILEENEKRKSKYTIFNVEIEKPNIIIGVNPNIANTIFENILKNKIIDEFQDITTIKREKKILESRIDFYIKKIEKEIYAEVKNVPLADYVDVPKKERHKYNDMNYDMYQKIAIFPDGYRKKSSDLISPRAYKHVNDLITLQKNENHQCYLIFMIQRCDVQSFKPSIIDEIYHDKVYEAIENGVKVIPICIIWKENKAYFHKICDFLHKI